VKKATVVDRSVSSYWENERAVSGFQEGVQHGLLRKWIPVSEVLSGIL